MLHSIRAEVKRICEMAFFKPCRYKVSTIDGTLQWILDSWMKLNKNFLKINALLQKKLIRITSSIIRTWTFTRKSLKVIAVGAKADSLQIKQYNTSNRFDEYVSIDTQ